MTRKVDHSAIRINQSFIISLLILAFVVDTAILVGFVSVVLIAGTFFPQAALFKQVYKQVLKPRGIVEPDVIEDNPEPHNFSQGLGGLFTGASVIALISGVATVGWVLSGIVVVLASLNLFAGFCAGCFVYYQLSKHNVPGFEHQPVHGK
jgi:hypothetical protein